MKVDGFLVAMAAVVGFALAAPSVGAAGGPIPFGQITDLGIGAIFFLHGANLSPDVLRRGAANWRLHLFVQSATFVLFPMLGLLVFYGSRGFLPPHIRLGVFFLSAICSTISSSVAMVAIARGNLAVAIFNASLSGLIGMVATPMLLGLVQTSGQTHLPVLQAAADIALKLLAPFIAGHLMRPLLAAWISRWKTWINRMDRAVILLIVYTAFCQSTHDGVWSRFGVLTLFEVLLLVGVLLGAMLSLTTLLARILGFSKEDEIAAVFCGSKKSLASGAPIGKILFASSPGLGAILLPLMIYHQLQLIVCSHLARQYAQRPELSQSRPVEANSAVRGTAP